MRSIPLFGLGLFFALCGLGLFGYTLRKIQPAAAEKSDGAPVKKSELREKAALQQSRQTETNKLRIAATISVVAGAALMALS